MPDGSGLPAPDDGLTPAESATLIVLMVTAGPISNTQLSERFKIKLDGKSRRKLNELKYVESWREGRQFVHQLSEKGWARCRKELNFNNPNAKALSAALSSILAGVLRHIDRTNSSLATVFGPDTTPPGTERPDVGQPNAAPPTEAAGHANAAGTQAGDRTPGGDLSARIRLVYAHLAPRPGTWVSIADLRDRLPDARRDDVDAALRHLERAADVNIVPESNQKALSDRDRGSAVRIGGQDKHFLAIGV